MHPCHSLALCFFLPRLIAAISQSAEVESAPPTKPTYYLNESITFTCIGDDENSIYSRDWIVNGTIYSLTPAFNSLWTQHHEYLYVNTSALGFPLCSMDLTCEIFFSNTSALSPPVHLKINESIAAPNVTTSHYSLETGCIEIQWQHPPQCSWATVLSNVTSLNSTMPSSENNAGNYTSCIDSLKPNDVYVFKITPFNKFQVGNPTTVSITIPTAGTSPTSTTIPTATSVTHTILTSTTTSTASGYTSTFITPADTPTRTTAVSNQPLMMVDVLTPILAALIILIALALLLVVIALVLRKRPRKREKPQVVSLDADVATVPITVNTENHSIETTSKSDSNTSSTFRLVIQVVSSPRQPSAPYCQQPVPNYQYSDNLSQSTNQV